ncbi:RagB/SusD family nutrient uptake outer membrane protein [Pedobacter nyackensis]|uniref:SusD family protein n=1 Tax=Pedobacter nyackensis TaxID=475255 RepID=A0A1W2CR36_9SPHI|nr:RagB/SusD family nutrient uptake outer membrane protein [Pedobacter nyackensis]SMC87436.1 SusD family protein [Pedobacter nyackensis]
MNQKTQQKRGRITILKFGYFVLFSLALIGTGGCSKMLDLPARDKFPQDILFKDEQGFIDALTGIYIGMDKPNNGPTEGLYTNNLTAGMLSIMAYNYTNASSSSASSGLYANASRYNYEDSGVKKEIAGIWAGMYNNIANLNNLLRHIDEKRGLFTRDNFYRVKGEALALRALFHFDLARLFGQPPLTGADAPAIPYITKFDIQTKQFVSLNMAVDSCIADLQSAKTLLSQTDTTALKMGSHDLFSSYTQNHMNYWATQALLARAYQYKGDHTNAIKAAQALIGSNKFPLITTNVASSSNTTRDRLFSQELVFSLYSNKVTNINNSLFNIPNTALTLAATNKDLIYKGSTGSATDYRYISWFDANTPGVNVPSKLFQDAKLPYFLQNNIPLLRISEMYYIAAESAGRAGDLGAALSYLNRVRVSRGLTDLTTTTVIDQEILYDEIMKEYKKEFIQEGQTFLYYKRWNKDLAAVTGTTVIVPKGAYVFPIPDKEIEYNH